MVCGIDGVEKIQVRGEYGENYFSGCNPSPAGLSFHQNNTKRENFKMENYTNRRVGNEIIAPPFCIYLRHLGIFLILITIGLFGSVNAQNPLAGLGAQLKFETGTANLVDPGAAEAVAAEIMVHFAAKDSQIVVISIRTQKVEIPVPELSNFTNLQRARAAVIKALFLENNLLDRDEMQVHSSIAYNGDPADIWFELRMLDGSMAGKEADASGGSQTALR
jgi:hypothetical protein